MRTSEIAEIMAAQSSVTIPLAEITITDYEQLMREGYGDEDISVLYRLKVL
jgi:3-hydroxyisobutyrate dehydrogenase